MILTQSRRLASQLLRSSLKSQILRVVAANAQKYCSTHNNKYTGVRLEADFESPKWIERHRHMFHFLDRDGNGKISLDELIYKASEEICTNIEATPAQTERHTEAVKNFFSGAGLKLGIETEWDEYIEGWKTLCILELDRWKKNQVTLIRLWGDALFDIIDKDGNGSISFDEWKRYTHCAGIIQTDEDCRMTFEVCDLDGDGKITVDEMTRQHVGFWYTADPKSDGLYGKSVP